MQPTVLFADQGNCEFSTRWSADWTEKWHQVARRTMEIFETQACHVILVCNVPLSEGELLTSEPMCVRPELDVPLFHQDFNLSHTGGMSSLTISRWIPSGKLTDVMQKRERVTEVEATSCGTEAKPRKKYRSFKTAKLGINT